MSRKARKTRDRPAAVGSANRTPLFVAIAFLAACVVYFGAWNLDFTNYDDPDYVTNNPEVLRGVTAEGVGWAFTTGHAANWHPATWISHMVDVSLFGDDPGGHHFTNVLLHAICAALLFLALNAATGASGPSLLVALLFAVHPMQVETVAWISSRKGLLSSAFALGALWLYAGPRTRRRFIGVHVLLALGLMAKPMMVTWPFVLLLFDRWPLRRTDPWRQLIVEKAGLFALAAATAVITVFVQRSGGSVVDLESIPLVGRLVNAVVSYAAYVAKLVWPWPLATPYPHPWLVPGWNAWSPATVVISALFLTAILAASWLIVRRRSWPWWPVGMLWFFGMLVPVIGLVHVGNQAMADRYVYLPAIGLFVAVVWTVRVVDARFHRVATFAALAVILGFGVMTQKQMHVWENSIALFEHATARTRDNWLAWNNLGTALRADNRQTEALAAFDQSLQIRPDYSDALFNRGNTLTSLERLDEAESSYRAALEHAPNRADVMTNLGRILLQQGRLAEALPFVEGAANASPHDVSTRINLAATLMALGENERAMEVVTQAQRDFPDAPRQARNVLADLKRRLQM